MKRTLLSFLLLFAATAMNAQTIVMGDMNDDKELTITDAVSVVDVILGKAPKQTISLGGDPYGVDNTLVVGTWYAPDGSSFEFKEDGTTTYPGGATYEFMPMSGRLLIYIAKNHPVKVLPIVKATSDYLLVVDYATGGFTYYTKSSSLASGITLDQTSLAMNSGTTAQLTASITPEAAFASITWTSSNESVATVDANGLVTAVAGGSCTITATTSGSQKTATCSVIVTQMVTSITLSQTTAVLELEASVYLTASVLPDNAANKEVVWSSSDEDIARVSRFGKVTAEYYGTAVITCEAADGSGVKATCKIYIDNPNSYVDLGLPSGTLWATCNVGASSPEDYGDYFAWGETSAKTSYNADWSNYFDTDDNGNTFKKYNNNGGLTELELEDDAAYVNWGPAWRMPSMEQIDELRTECTWTWTTMNNVDGYKITGSNGNSIFLPAAGVCYDSSLTGVGTYGAYWSRTFYSGRPSDAWYMWFNSDDYGKGYGFRYNGFRVRPVCAPE
jgi:uncharacterized protein YjdB